MKQGISKISDQSDRFEKRRKQERLTRNPNAALIDQQFLSVSNEL